jgi:plasmid stabilization system protein ParE
MKYRVIFSSTAEDDVAEILAYLLPRAGEQVARRYIDHLIDYCYSFETFPKRGTVFEGQPGLRLVGYRRRATIAFHVNEQTVVIARVFHRGRQIEFADEQDDLA